MDQTLPPFLQSRCRWLLRPEVSRSGPGEFVLYWMHNALRVTENPALDVAVRLARQNGLPLLVYQGLSEDYPYASDRLHTFILQGHRDVAFQMQQNGIATHCDFQCHGNRGPTLKRLCSRAAVLVTEWMPIEPLVGWLDSIVGKLGLPTVAIDTHCLLPAGNHVVSEYFKTANDEHQFCAARYQQLTWPAYQSALQTSYAAEPPDCLMADVQSSALTPDWSDLSRWIGRCRIDHSIPPIREMPGGTRAGMQHLQRFLQRDPKLGPPPGGTMLSAYVHFGMLSPFQIARQAAAAGHDHFLKQFLIWRELAFHYCDRFAMRLETLEGIPRWARQTLRIHESTDHRPCISWENLLRGQTPDLRFNELQRELLRRGTLAAPPRRQWGKRVLGLTSTPHRALRCLIDLNHRLSLDGRDPSAYGGIHWCFGQFDQPNATEAPIFGTVRTTDQIEMPCPAPSNPPMESSHRVAIIGAGIGGLIAARLLSDFGLDVTVFEKSSGVGGRMATRRSDNEITFDHGAQYFTARDARFKRYVRSWIDDGVAAIWNPHIVAIHGQHPSQHERISDDTMRYVGVPTNHTIGKHLASGLDVRLNTRIETANPVDAGGWQLVDQHGQKHAAFDTVICNAPPPQTAAIVAQHADWWNRLNKYPMQRCITLMLQVDMHAPEFEGAFINHHAIAWIARNDRKPGRRTSPEGPSAWVVQASGRWSQDHFDDCEDELKRILIAGFVELVGHPIQRLVSFQIQRWRYSKPAETDGVYDDDPPECFFDAAAGWGVCGDWLCGGRVEGAFLSGQAVAGALLRHLTIDRPCPIQG